MAEVVVVEGVGGVGDGEWEGLLAVTVYVLFI